MAEPTPPPEPGHPESQPVERSIFPLDSDIVDRTVATIQADPLGVYPQIEREMMRENRGLVRNLQAMAKASRPQFMEFNTGMLAAYRLLHAQAEEVGKPLPKVTQAVFDAYLRDIEETPVDTAQGATDYGSQALDKIAREGDVVFKDGINALAVGDSYEGQRADFRLYAAHVYNAVSKESAAEEMRKQFGVDEA